MLNISGKWAEMGEQSSSIYEQRFKTEKIIHKFIEQYEQIKKK